MSTHIVLPTKHSLKTVRLAPTPSELEFVIICKSNDKLKKDRPEESEIYFAKSQGNDKCMKHSFITQTATTFSAVQKRVSEIANSSSIRHNDDLYTFSTAYLAEIKKYLSRLKSQRPVDETEYVLFEAIHEIWKLCHLLSFSPQRNEPVAEAYVSWLNEGSPVTVDSRSTTWTDEHWDLVYRLACRGMMNDCIMILKKHKELESHGVNYLSSIAELLSSFPRFSRIKSVQEYCKKMVEWKREWAVLTDEQTLLSIFPLKEVLPYLQNLFKIISGEEAAIKVSSTNWKEQLSAALLYSHPSATRDDLETIVLKYCKEQNMTTFDQALISFIKGDFIMGLSCCSKIDFWLVAHLSDLVEHFNLIDELQRAEFEKCEYSLREYFILEFVNNTLVKSYPNLWPITVEYLKSCPINGIEMIREILARQSITTTREAHLIINAFESCNLIEDKKAFCRLLGVQALKHQLYAEAVYWFFEAKSSKHIAATVDMLVANYSNTGDISSLEKIASLCQNRRDNAIEILSDRLYFVKNYVLFHHHFREKKFMQAANQLFDLFGNSPMHYRPLLFIDFLPLLQGKSTFVSGRCTVELMSLLEEFTNHKRYIPEEKKDASWRAFENIEQVFRRFLVHNSISWGEEMEE